MELLDELSPSGSNQSRHIWCLGSLLQTLGVPRHGRERMEDDQDSACCSSFETSDFEFQRSWQVQDEIEFVCGDPRYQSPETLRALIAHLKGNETASLDRILDLQTAKLGKKIRKRNICRKDFFASDFGEEKLVLLLTYGHLE